MGKGCAVFATFFIRFEVNPTEYGSYSLHFRYIRKHHLFASFTSYCILFKIFTQICIQIFNLMQINTCCSDYSLQRKIRQSKFSPSV
jgi:hypothetical protein